MWMEGRIRDQENVKTEHAAVQQELAVQQSERIAMVRRLAAAEALSMERADTTLDLEQRLTAVSIEKADVEERLVDMISGLRSDRRQQEVWVGRMIKSFFWDRHGGEGVLAKGEMVPLLDPRSTLRFCFKFWQQLILGHTKLVMSTPKSADASNQ
ncbi:hypothetical protein CYMTET_27557 [Cymbomonas tetramitiformis]|uniref:Uncharacterized protein n=1 Tax=Cymbomonas tetramitiformis TaxID=36881 RepID=A0AAE0FPI2_9CHLO|nr:hypothetical protein CYMTET_27557 [Cymbomonas tetramitiformis]